MIRVHLLHEKPYSRNGEGFLFPVHFNRRRLADHGISLRFGSTPTPAFHECDILCVSSRFFRRWWGQSGGQERLLEWLGRAGETAGRVLWFDLSDSTGTTQFKVLPSVDGYVKNQMLRDRSLYQRTLYGNRLFTDFYHRHFGIEDDNPDAPHLNWFPPTEQLGKIRAGWNYGMANHSPAGLRLGQIWYGRRILPNWYPKRWSTPAPERPVPCSCRIGSSYERNTIAFPRRRILECVKGRMGFERVTRRQYFRELRDSTAAISPFGFGEVCYRDFEAIICGAAMVKQDMSHLETWPDLWIKDRTYWSLSWDLSDLDEKLQYVLDHPARMVEIATRAQRRYRRLLETEEGHQEFCTRFKAILNGRERVLEPEASQPVAGSVS